MATAFGRQQRRSRAGRNARQPRTLARARLRQRGLKSRRTNDLGSTAAGLRRSRSHGHEVIPETGDAQVAQFAKVA